MALELRQFGLALGVAVLQGYRRETHCAEITWKVFCLLIEDWAQGGRIEPVLAKPLFVPSLVRHHDGVMPRQQWCHLSCAHEGQFCEDGWRREGPAGPARSLCPVPAPLPLPQQDQMASGLAG